ncbi:[FeFe] hydrogenase, group A [Acetivibrio cellulolyticus]|uniref:[FeFe] hydrogenase, group A n=1 Tax=Acetivibrio cellulolyticus TaxID=35830 RepID=UPI0001E2CCB6|nr:[FeFe] hydrogenase, group A [Acetivibrio cellulolyticus]
MNSKQYMTIDGIPVEINGEKNLLELIRKVGIKLPTFCYHSELSIYGACRMCMIENEWGGLDAACSTPPKAGMNIKTNTARLQKYRKMILELLLANHCRDCTTCSNNGKCKLQDLAMRYNINSVRFPNTASEPMVDDSSLCITRDQNKCILCGDCVRVCNEVQNVGAIDFGYRGSKMKICTAFDKPIAQSNCVGCGQCALACPTGAIVIKNNTDKVWKEIYDNNTKVTVQIAPAVRVALGKELGLNDGENAIGRIVAALRRMGFDEIYDTSTGADLTVLEESAELLKRIKDGNNDMPLFTSCCPAWVNFCEKHYPELLPNVSTCRSPMQMFASVIKEQNSNSSRRVVHVAVMPCTAKKFEAAREEFKVNGVPNVDYVISTQELIQMIKESGIIFTDLEPEAIDMPFGTHTGAGVIFGVTGGVTEGVLRRVVSDKSATSFMTLSYAGIRGLEGVKEASLMYGDRKLKIAVVSGLKNASKLIEKIKAGEHYDLVEVMACPGGCINGGGQPFVSSEERERRGKGLYSADKLCSIKSSEENPLMMSLYNGVLKGRVHELLHVNYAANKEAD